MSFILETYSPRTLDDIRGQRHVTSKLAKWLRQPRSTAMIFAGATGVGKSATAEVLAQLLGCNVDEGEFGGLYEISSGGMGKPEVVAAVNQLYRTPLSGSGWKVLVCNECDEMTSMAEVAWLDPLDRISKRGEPPRSLIVFTTNAPERLSDRLRDRCADHFYAFESRPALLRPAIQELAQEIWAAECPGEPYPFGPNLGMRALSGDGAEAASFRLALQSIQKALNERMVEPACSLS